VSIAETVLHGFARLFALVDRFFSNQIHQISRFCGFSELIIDIGESAMTFNF